MRKNDAGKIEFVVDAETDPKTAGHVGGDTTLPLPPCSSV